MSSYLIALQLLFAAVDRGDLGEANRLDATGTDVALDDMQDLVVDAATQKRGSALADLDELHDLESLDRCSPQWCSWPACCSLRC